MFFANRLVRKFKLFNNFEQLCGLLFTCQKGGHTFKDLMGLSVRIISRILVSGVLPNERFLKPTVIDPCQECKLAFRNIPIISCLRESCFSLK